MKKKVYGRKFSRERDTRRALFRSLVKALVEHGKIVTTKAKAKATQPLVDKVVNLAKKKEIASQRRLFSLLGNDKKTTKLLVEKIAPLFPDRASGFTRIISLPPRRGDQAPMVRLEWVRQETVEVKKTKAQKETKREAKRVASGSKTEKTQEKKKKKETKKKTAKAKK